MLDDEAGPMESTRARNFSQLFLRRMGRAKRNPSPPHLGTDGTMGFASLYPSYEGRTWPQVRRPHWCDVTVAVCRARDRPHVRSEEHTSELQSLMRISYAVFCLKKKNIIINIRQ